jgi:hypothetical protein
MLWLLLIQTMSVRPAACQPQSPHECGAATTTVEKGPALTVAMSRSFTQGIANGETFTDAVWDCEVQVIGRGKTVKAQHHAEDLKLDLKPGRYNVRFDSCFGCALDVPVTIAKDKAVRVEATCHTQGK